MVRIHLKLVNTSAKRLADGSLKKYYYHRGTGKPIKGQPGTPEFVDSYAEAAKREVQEEAGLKDLSVKNQLGVTRFKFQAEETVVHKTVHYFLMTTTQKELTPQAEEALLDAKWFTFSEALSSLEYDTDQEVVRRAEEVLTGTKRPGRNTGSASGRQLKIHT